MKSVVSKLSIFECSMYSYMAMKTAIAYLRDNGLMNDEDANKGISKESLTEIPPAMYEYPYFLQETDYISRMFGKDISVIRKALKNLEEQKLINRKMNKVYLTGDLFKYDYYKLDDATTNSYVLAYIRSKAKKCGYTIVDASKIAEDTGLGINQIYPALKKLKAKGKINRVGKRIYPVYKNASEQTNEQKSVSAPAPQEQLTDNKLQELFDDYGQNKKVETGHKPVSYNNEQTRVEIESLNDWSMCRASSPEEVIMLKSMPVIIQHTPFS